MLVTLFNVNRAKRLSRKKTTELILLCISVPDVQNTSQMVYRRGSLKNLKRSPGI